MAGADEFLAQGLISEAEGPDRLAAAQSPWVQEVDARADLKDGGSIPT